MSRALALLVAALALACSPTVDGSADLARHDGGSLGDGASHGDLGAGSDLAAIGDGASAILDGASAVGDGASASDGAIPVDAIVADDAAGACGAVGEACCASGGCATGNVCAGGTCVAALAAAQCPGGATAAVFVGEVAPPSTLAPWQRFAAAVTFANCSGVTWNATAAGAATGYKLGAQAPQDDDVWAGSSRVALPTDVPSGMQVTVPIAVVAPALTGPRGYAWAIVDEGVAWLAAPSPTHTIDVEATPQQATICAGQSGDIGGGSSVSSALQACIDATPSGGTLALPAGIYRLTTALTIAQPITLTTSGTAGDGRGCLDFAGPPCAVLRADDSLTPTRGFVVVGAGGGVTLDHIVVDGNRGRRTAGGAANQCAAGNNGPGMNLEVAGCAGCAFTHSGSARAVCGSGAEWVGDQASIVGSTFRDNGDHATQNLWSDGLTLLRSNGAHVTGCSFIDNSDVDLILGGNTGGAVEGNTVRQLQQASFAGLMLDNFNGGTPGDFAGTTVSNNSVDCTAQRCDFAIELGPHPWYPSSNITGGVVTGNSVAGGKFGIDVSGGGTAAAPITVDYNTIGPSPSSATLLCGTHATSAFNISPDSVVDRGGDTAPATAISVDNCP